MSERKTYLEQTRNKILKVDWNDLQKDCMNKNCKGHVKSCLLGVQTRE